DGVAHNLISSVLTSYDDPDHDDVDSPDHSWHPDVNREFGVHTHTPVDPFPPAAMPSQPTIFMSGRQVGVPPVDFVGITQTLSQMSTDAQASGFYRASSTAYGYEIVFKTDDTFDLYKVTSLTVAPQYCTNSQNQSGWGTWTIFATTSLGNYPFPANGIIFLEDHAWIRGQINGARLVVGARNALGTGSITLNNNLLYTNYDGTDVIGLIAEYNINTGLGSADVERIDAALIAQSGRAGRYYYGSNCGTGYIRNTLTLYGMIASSLRYGFAYTNGTGYQIRNITYDGNLLFGPPPNFPLTGDQYVQISWDEVK
ncbi:MAG: hypothetical protein AAB631_00675, partial [Patescibacteria group bacterium]